jgi:hypothetical protein
MPRWPGTRKRWWLVVLTGGLLAAVIAGFVSHGGAELVWPDPGDTTSFSATLPDLAPGEPMSLGVSVVCVRGGPNVRVDRVDLLDPRNIVVQAFGLRPSPGDATGGGEFLGDEPKPLVGLGFPTAGRPMMIGKHCYSGTRVMTPSEGNWELAVQVARTAAGTGSEHGLLIRYESAGRAHTLKIPFVITLCAYGDPAIPYCKTTRWPKS